MVKILKLLTTTNHFQITSSLEVKYVTIVYNIHTWPLNIYVPDMVRTIGSSTTVIHNKYDELG